MWAESSEVSCQVALEFEEEDFEQKLVRVLKLIEEFRPNVQTTRGVGPADCADYLREMHDIEASKKVIQQLKMFAHNNFFASAAIEAVVVAVAAPAVVAAPP